MYNSPEAVLLNFRRSKEKETKKTKTKKQLAVPRNEGGG